MLLQNAGMLLCYNDSVCGGEGCYAVDYTVCAAECSKMLVCWRVELCCGYATMMLFAGECCENVVVRVAMLLEYAGSERVLQNVEMQLELLCYDSVSAVKRVAMLVFEYARKG